MRLSLVLAGLIAGIAASGSAQAYETPSSSTILGTNSELLGRGSEALEQGRAEDGIRLTLLGIKASTDFHDIVVGNDGKFSAIAGYDLATGWAHRRGST